MAQPQTFWTYALLWFRVAREGTFDVLGALSLVFSAVFWAWRKWESDSFGRAAAAVGLSPDAAMSDLVWEIPIAVAAVLFGWRFVRAPYEIHRATITSADRSLLDVRAALSEAQSALMTIRAENKGVELVCSRRSLSWGPVSDLPPGILVALDIDRLVNGNTFSVVLDIKLVVPLWQPSGAFSVTTNCQPLVRSVAHVRSTLPQLPPLVNLNAKQAIGPGFFLFFFSLSGLKNASDWVPESARATSLDDFAELIKESEAEVHMTDVANRVVLSPVPLPGTSEKRLRRLDKERQALGGQGNE
jgi:hypothetical protein